MSGEATARILDDSELAGSTEDERRAHYMLIRNRYLRLRQEISPTDVDVDETIRGFAKFAGCRPSQVTYVEAVESGGRRPLSDEEWQSVLSTDT